MIKIIILPHLKLCPYGKFIKIKKSDKDLCDILLDNNINIEHSCEKFGKCTTCKIYLINGKFILNKMDYDEIETLKKNFNNYNKYRLSCQVFFDRYRNTNIIIRL